MYQVKTLFLLNRLEESPFIYGRFCNTGLICFELQSNLIFVLDITRVLIGQPTARALEYQIVNVTRKLA